MATEHWQIELRDNRMDAHISRRRVARRDAADGQAMRNLLEAFGLLAQRGSSGLRWAAPSGAQLNPAARSAGPT
jgi:hypothetical protein